MRYGRAVCGDLGAADAREWLLTNGRGGYGMGTVAATLTRLEDGLPRWTYALAARLVVADRNHHGGPLRDLAGFITNPPDDGATAMPCRVRPRSSRGTGATALRRAHREREHRCS